MRNQFPKVFRYVVDSIAACICMLTLYLYRRNYQFVYLLSYLRFLKLKRLLETPGDGEEHVALGSKGAGNWGNLAGGVKEVQKTLDYTVWNRFLQKFNAVIDDFSIATASCSY